MTCAEKNRVKAALRAAFQRALEQTLVTQDGESLLFVFKQLTSIAFDLAEIGEAPRELIAARLMRTARKRLPKLKPVLPSWPMKPGVA